MCGVRERSSRDRWRLSKCGACVYTAHNFVTAYVNYFGVVRGGGVERASVWDPLSVSHSWDSRFSRRVVLFGFFPYPYPPPPSMPSPSPPLQGSNHVLPKPHNLAPAPLAIPDIPTIETSQNIPLIPQSLDHGGSKRSFRIDAKKISFSFDGG